jgi:hypothetical protein
MSIPITVSALISLIAFPLFWNLLKTILLYLKERSFHDIIIGQIPVEFREGKRLLKRCRLQPGHALDLGTFLLRQDGAVRGRVVGYLFFPQFAAKKNLSLKFLQQNIPPPALRSFSWLETTPRKEYPKVIETQPRSPHRTPPANFPHEPLQYRNYLGSSIYTGSLC